MVGIKILSDVNHLLSEMQRSNVCPHKRNGLPTMGPSLDSYSGFFGLKRLMCRNNEKKKRNKENIRMRILDATRVYMHFYPMDVIFPISVAPIDQLDKISPKSGRYQRGWGIKK